MEDYNRWALGELSMRRTPDNMAYEELVKTLAALCTGTGQYFGVGLGNLDPEIRPQLKAGVIEILVGYKAHYEANDMLSWLFELDGLATRFSIPELKITKRFPLKCDPLGERAKLSAPWKERLARLDAVRAGTARFNLAAVGFDDAPSVTFGERDDEALYRLALMSERGGATFPRELAAWVTTANGIFVGDTPFFEPVKQWRDDEIGKTSGLRIGAGADFQGSLFLVGALKKGVDKLRVTQTDDEVVTKKYASFTELVDALLGSA